MLGPCDWPESPCEACPPPEGASDAVTGQASQLAAWMLWSWSGQNYGLCETTVRPCDQNGPVCGCGGRRRGVRTCACGEVPEVILPGPVHSIVEVTVGGVVLDPCDYRVDNYRALVRLDGGRWPPCQDMTAPQDGPGGFSVTYLRGVEPPPGTGLVTGELACQLTHALCSSPGCKLPVNIRSKTRQGVTVSYKDISIGTGTGIASVDMWLTVARQRARKVRVWSPDRATTRYTTWTCAGDSP